MVTQLFGITMPSDQLTNVVSAFARWRSNKKGMKTPNALREQAVAL
jgi:hypothetical protein